LKPKETEVVPQTLGEHVRKRRQELKLSQDEAGTLLGVTSFTVLNWEKGKTEPPIASLPSILQFLGYDPYPEPTNLPERLLAKRRQMGWSLKEAARHFGVDEGMWGDWERGATVPKGRHRKCIEAFLVAGVSSF